MDKNKNEQVVRRSEDTMKYIAVISSLLTQQITAKHTRNTGSQCRSRLGRRKRRKDHDEADQH